MNEENLTVAPAEEVAVPAEETNVMEEVMHDENAPIITMRKLLEAGTHYGHPTRRWNPKMGRYIYGARNGIYIVDLAKTAAAIVDAYTALKQIVANNGKVLFVGVKPQAKAIVEEQALRSGSFYISNRWLGGCLTNFRTIQSRIRHLKELEQFETDGTFDRLPKKEVALLKKEKEKLEKNLGGIKEMRKLPNAIVIVDPKVEHNAILEAHKLNITVLGIDDTNSDPDTLDYAIPGNDDSVKSIKLIMTVLADAIVEAKGSITEIAHVKDEGEEVTMKDAIRQADKENAERLAAIRKARAEKAERQQKILAAKKARYEAAQKKAEEKPAEEAKSAEENKETK